MAMAAKEEGEEKWVKHYSSTHQILLVGEGDFSFSLCLALSFGSPSNICASSLDLYDMLISKYKKAKSNLQTLEKLGACILHGVDATKMKLHPHLQMRKFDRIIFNFPHAGFHGKEENVLMIKMHRSLVQGFFRNASCMLRAGGEVHVSHKTTGPFCSWNLEELACRNSLLLIECVSFKIEDYPGYNNKRGDGKRCDVSFPLGECSIFKFRFSPPVKKSRRARKKKIANKSPQQLQEIPIHMQKQESSFDVRCFHTNLTIDMNRFPGHVEAPLMTNIGREYGWFNMARERLARAPNGVDYFVQEPHRFDSFRHPLTNFNRNMNDQHKSARISSNCFHNFRETLGRAGHRVDYMVYGSLFSGLERYVEEAAERTLNGCAYMDELHLSNGVDYFVQEPHRFDYFRHPHTNINGNMNDQQESARISSSCFNNFRETIGRVGHGVDYTVHGSLSSVLERYMVEAPERTLNGCAYLDELRHLNGVDYFVQEPHRFDNRRHTHTSINGNMNDQQEGARIFSSCFNNFKETLGRAGHRVDYTFHGPLFSSLERYMEEAPERTINGYAHTDEFRHSNSLRSAWLQSMVVGSSSMQSMQL
ncbi:uncharacterized protein LOC123197710 [Mangifera indica]|uniref:uncharacterized protein LOC123197710 n=1 Tax=Mangifera indica TaxID=29780 RepID=UPI001CF93724|nr:uncharacterized protein LOC123197710 [Mangifera indica]